jgi:hypothetical protein
MIGVVGAEEGDHIRSQAAAGSATPIATSATIRLTTNACSRRIGLLVVKDRVMWNVRSKAFNETLAMAEERL